MATPTFSAFGNTLVTKQWTGNHPKTSPFGIEFETKEGVLFDVLYRYFCFGELLEGAMTVKAHPEDASYDGEVEMIERLREQIAGGQVKITIKLEIEKYAR